MIRIRRALISVADKTGIVQFAQLLASHNVELISTGGTGAVLRDAGLDVQEISSVTGLGPLLSGRVKTLHPAIFGAILNDRDNPAHAEDLERIKAAPIDLVVVNFYSFAAAVARDASDAELVENIDIGGPSMVRAAAKNHQHVAVASDPADYSSIADALSANQGCIPRDLARDLAAKAFARTCSYDNAIAGWLASSSYPPPAVNLSAVHHSALRYGENPHQQAAAYAVPGAGFSLLAGQDVSYNNLQDAVCAWRSVAEFDQPACSIIKHASPCGIALGENCAQAYQRAHAADPLSAFGGVVALNRELDESTAEQLAKHFVEVLVAPSISPAQQQKLAGKKRPRVLAAPLGDYQPYDLRSYGGLVLSQQRDATCLDLAGVQAAAGSSIDEKLASQLLLAWQACKHAKSNAIVIARDAATIGIGAGQPSRVQAAQLAVGQALKHGHECKGAVAASDGFLPFADTIEVLAQAGIAALIQPGGSKRDPEVAQAADKAGIVMVMAGMRHFTH